MKDQGPTQGSALNRLDRFSIATGKLISWLTLIMVLVTTVIVVMRYVFDAGFIWLQESVIWMHAIVFMAGAAFTLQQEDHVRVDIFYRATGDKGRAWTDLIGVVLFLLPLCAFLSYSSYGFAAVSWSLHEASRESGGLPYPMIPLLKSVLLFMPIAVGLQGISLLRRSVLTIKGSR
jgi:TRAP-type mannitol/chloroaromatic compound transport system permease small subunit